MNLHQLFLTKNDCYKTYRKHTPKGIMVHSTGSNNQWIKRYVGPDDGILGKNLLGNHWNKPGLDKCVHAFIGRLENGSVATYQTLPWEIAGWHSGSGNKGNANYMGYLGFEICEDNLKYPLYFRIVFNEAVDLCVFLCKKFGLTEKNIICHSEGNKLGIASNHADVMHWFPKHGESMDSFRAAVRAKLVAKPAEPQKPEPKTTPDTYVVKKGDNLSKIAAAHGLKWPDLAALNGIKWPYIIKPNQVIRLK